MTHLSCRRQRVIRVRANAGGARFLVSGSGGAVYVVDPADWSCTCPNHPWRGKGCKHSIACWALWRASARPVLPAPTVANAKGARVIAEGSGPYELRKCPGCFHGLVYDGERGAWVDHNGCSGTGRARIFVYAKARDSGRSAGLRRCSSCGERFVGRDLEEVGPEQAQCSPTVSEGDALCGRCAVGRGVL